VLAITDGGQSYLLREDDGTSAAAMERLEER
jgi:hypothetical protein